MHRGRPTSVSTGVEGLDDLLVGGLQFWPQEGRPTVVVRGGPGSGKTTLCMQAALAVCAQQGCSCLFFSSEARDIASLRRRLTWLRQGRADNVEIWAVPAERPGFERWNTPTPAIAESLPAGRPLLIASALPRGLPVSLVLETTMVVLDRVTDRAAAGAVTLVVFDSLNGLCNGVPSREEFASLATAMQERGLAAIFIVEAEQLGDVALHIDFTADIVVEMGVEPGTVDGYSERYVDIVKARDQFHHRGRHAIAIAPTATGGGVVVFPSLPAVLWREQYGKPRWVAHRRLPQRPSRRLMGEPLAKTGIDRLDKLLGGGLARGGTHLLQGEWEAGAGLLAHSFLMAGWRQREVGLLLALKGPVALDGRATGGPWPVSRGVYRVVRVRPGYHSPGKALTTLVDWVEETSKDARGPVRRLVIDSLMLQQMFFPLLARSPTFMAVLCDVLSGRGITAVLIEDSAEEIVPRSLATTVLRCRRVVSGGTMRLLVDAVKGVATGTGPPVLELAQDPRGRAELVPSEYVVRDGAVQQLPLEFTLYGETTPQRTFANDISMMLSDAYGSRVKCDIRGPQPMQGMYRALDLNADEESTVGHIVAIDEGVLPNLMESGCLAALPADLVAPHWPKARSKCFLGSACFAVPYYLNVGALVCDRALLRCLRLAAPRTLQDIVDLGDEAVRQAHLAAPEELPSHVLLLPTDLPNEGAAALLELLLACSERQRTAIGSGAPPDFADRDFARLLHRLLRLNAKLSQVRSDRGIPDTGDPRPILAREWLTKVMARTLEAPSAGDPDGQRPRSSGCTSVLPSRALWPGALTGDWFLGVTRGSILSDDVRSVLRRLTDTGLGEQKLLRCVGLPTMRIAGARVPGLRRGLQYVLRALYNHAIPRGAVPWLQAAAPALRALLAEANARVAEGLAPRLSELTGHLRDAQHRVADSHREWRRQHRRA